MKTIINKKLPNKKGRFDAGILADNNWLKSHGYVMWKKGVKRKKCTVSEYKELVFSDKFAKKKNRKKAGNNKRR